MRTTPTPKDLPRPRRLKGEKGEPTLTAVKKKKRRPSAGEKTASNRKTGQEQDFECREADHGGLSKDCWNS